MLTARHTYDILQPIVEGRAHLLWMSVCLAIHLYNFIAHLILTMRPGNYTILVLYRYGNKLRKAECDVQDHDHTQWLTCSNTGLLTSSIGLLYYATLPSTLPEITEQAIGE